MTSTFRHSTHRTQRTSVEVQAAHVRSVAEVELAVAELGREPGSGLIAAADSFVLAMRGAIIKAADEHRLPVISPYRQFVAEGSLMSYGPDTADIFRRSSSYVDRILKGELPGNLPAQSPVKFELFVNLKTAKALGLVGSRIVLAARRRGDRISPEMSAFGTKRTSFFALHMSAFDPKADKR